MRQVRLADDVTRRDVQLELKSRRLLVPSIGLCGPRDLVSRRVYPAHCTLIVRWPDGETRLTKLRCLPNQRSFYCYARKITLGGAGSCSCFNPMSDRARVQYSISISSIELNLIIGFCIVLCLRTVKGIPARKQKSCNWIKRAPTEKFFQPKSNPRKSSLRPVGYLKGTKGLAFIIPVKKKADNAAKTPSAAINKIFGNSVSAQPGAREVAGQIRTSL